MDTNEKLREFMESIRMITPPYGSVANAGLVGQEQSNVAAERIQELHREAASFARFYQTAVAGHDEVGSQAGKVEALLRTAVVLNVLDEERAAKLIDDLQTLMEYRDKA